MSEPVGSFLLSFNSYSKKSCFSEVRSLEIAILPSLFHFTKKTFAAKFNIR